MINLLIALTLTGAIQAHPTMREAIRVINPCLLDQEPIQVLLRVEPPAYRLDTFRFEKTCFSLPDNEWQQIYDAGQALGWFNESYSVLTPEYPDPNPIHEPIAQPVPDDGSEVM